ncbi:hypothetical protein K491DRAFT_782332 [Lophiostoma macrostomum CBS 122681]|uniref:Uncharacterized protein n=1 Tax=Lophiostoma macrostomum CBS 122681 TaxID=1314788 RepID=A0A6A6SUT3_9PLEO|nr:hypothetical protein K491DRAFT_782332 [Lophiostoma macrostomum CBS 122681]
MSSEVASTPLSLSPSTPPASNSRDGCQGVTVESSGLPETIMPPETPHIARPFHQRGPTENEESSHVFVFLTGLMYHIQKNLNWPDECAINSSPRCGPYETLIVGIQSEKSEELLLAFTFSYIREDQSTRAVDYQEIFDYRTALRILLEICVPLDLIKVPEFIVCKAWCSPHFGPRRAPGAHPGPIDIRINLLNPSHQEGVVLTLPTAYNSDSVPSMMTISDSKVAMELDTERRVSLDAPLLTRIAASALLHFGTYAMQEDSEEDPEGNSEESWKEAPETTGLGALTIAD